MKRQVHITSDGTVRGTRLTMEDGAEVHGVGRIEVDVDAGHGPRLVEVRLQLAKSALDLWGTVDTEALLRTTLERLEQLMSLEEIAAGVNSLAEARRHHDGAQARQPANAVRGPGEA